MTAAGLVFTNIHDAAIPELTRVRTIASVPFGCRYRLVDFILSNMANADITVIGLITHNNYQSLLDHIGTGKDWDLARRNGGIKILPPFITAYENAVANKVYTSRLEALIGVMSFINHRTEDYFVLSDCDAVYNIDIADVLKKHEESGADVTIVAKEFPHDVKFISPHEEIIRFDENEKIYDIVKYSAHECENDENININMNVIVMSRSYLQNVLQDAAARRYTSFYQDIISKHIKKDNYHVYRYDGVYALISSLESYYKSNMMLLRREVRDKLFGIADRPVYTKIKNSPPTKYTDGSNVKNSLVADGCVISGTVEDSIIFRGVHVGEGTVVKSCILFQDTYVGNDAELTCVLTDKNVVIKDGRHLSGHSQAPFFIEKGKTL